MRSLATHYWRLIDLGALYTAAVNSPANFYTPYMSLQEVSDSADSLRLAALCVPEILQYCAMSGNCSKNDIVKWIVTTSKTCKAVASLDLGDDDTTRRQKSAVARFVFGSQFLRNLADETNKRNSAGGKSLAPFATAAIESPPTVVRQQL